MLTPKLQAHKHLDSVFYEMSDLLHQIHTLAKFGPPWTPLSDEIDLVYRDARNQLIHLRSTAELLVRTVPDDPKTTSILVDENHEGG